jgi:hypothetical protein
VMPEPIVRLLISNDIVYPIHQLAPSLQTGT